MEMGDIIEGAADLFHESSDSSDPTEPWIQQFEEAVPNSTAQFLLKGGAFFMTCLHIYSALFRTTTFQADGSSQLLTRHTVFILVATTILTAYYVQNTPPSLCLGAPQANPEYVQLFCGAKGFVWHSRHRDIYHTRIVHPQPLADHQIPLPPYQYLPLAYAIAAILCYLPQVLLKIMQNYVIPEHRTLLQGLTTKRSNLIRDSIKKFKNNSVCKSVILHKILCVIIPIAIASLIGYILYLNHVDPIYPLFPKACVCGLPLTGHAGQQIHIIRCILPQNYFTEQVLLLLFVWLNFVTLANFNSICIWVYHFTAHFVRNLLETTLPENIRHDDNYPGFLRSLTNTEKMYLMYVAENMD